MARHPDFAASERHELADLLTALGPDAPTLCPGWTTADLAAHLVVREGSPLDAAGIVVPALSHRTRTAMHRVLHTHGYLGVIGLLRTGPTGITPYRIGPVARAANLIEFFVHHEDVRRAQPEWTRRELPPGMEHLLWRRLQSAGRLFFRRSAVGVLLARSDGGATVRVRTGEPVAVVEGLPSEILIYAFDRKQAAQVDLRGPEGAVHVIGHTRLGL